MSQAENLLMSTTSVEGHICIDADRVITVPDELKRIAVQYDHNIETLTFDCPRYWDNIDMSGMTIYINYLCPDKTTGTYQVQNVTIDERYTTTMHFDWTISRNVTGTPGTVAFIVCIKNVDEDGNEINHWNSEICKDCYVSTGMDCSGESYSEIYPDIFNTWYKEVMGLVDTAVQATAEGIVDNATETVNAMLSNYAEAMPYHDARNADYNLDDIFVQGEHCAFYRIDDTTLGKTPYSLGLTTSAEGIVLSMSDKSGHYGQQVYFSLGTLNIYMRRMEEETDDNGITRIRIYEWRKLSIIQVLNPDGEYYTDNSPNEAYYYDISN